MKVVIDTNIFIAGRWRKRGSARRLINDCINGKLEALYTPDTRWENEHVLKKVRPPADYWTLIQQFFDAATYMPETEVPQIQASEDPDDDKFLACALGGQAEYIISSDHHLLDLDGFQGVKVRKAGAFYREIKVQNKES